MSDKSQLEKAIERQELVKKPLSMLVLIVILSFSIGALGIYTFKLKQKLSIKEKEIISLKSSFDKEKAGLLNEIKKLEKEYMVLDPDLEPATDNTNKVISKENDKRKPEK